MDLKQFDTVLHEAEVKLKRLKALYEQWFQGIERIEPQIARKDLERTFHLLKKEKPRNTAARFRLQQVFARFVTYQSYWGRIARKIEEGTYERDLRRVRSRALGMPAKPAEVKTFEVDVEEDFSEPVDEFANLLSGIGETRTEVDSEAPTTKRAFSAFSGFGRDPPSEAPTRQHKKAPMMTFGKPRASTPPDAAEIKERLVPTRPRMPEVPKVKPPVDAAPKAAPKTPPTPKTPPKPPTPPRIAAKRPPPTPSGARAHKMKEPPPPPRSSAEKPTTPDGMRVLFDKYVDARKKNNERVDHLKYDKMVSSIDKMRSKLEKKHSGKKVKFEVVLQNGRVGLKPKVD